MAVCSSRSLRALTASSHDYPADVTDGTRKLKRGEVIRTEVAGLDIGDKRILLSMRGGSAARSESTSTGETSAAPERMSGGAPSVAPKEARRGSTLGDLIKEKLGDLGDLPSKS
jgi:hypothetical protein